MFDGMSLKGILSTTGTSALTPVTQTPLPQTTDAPVSPAVSKDGFAGKSIMPVAEATNATLTLPAARSPEAALLQAMRRQPGLPPQWAEAFLRLPPDGQRVMAEMFQVMRPYDRPSFLIQPPETREAMAGLFATLDAEGQTAFTQLPTNQQRDLGTWHAAMPAEGRSILSSADVRGMGALLGNSDELERTLVRTKPMGEALAMARVYGDLPDGSRGEFGDLHPVTLTAVVHKAESLDPAARKAFLERPLDQVVAVATLWQDLSVDGRSALAQRPEADQLSLAQVYKQLSSEGRQALLARPPADQDSYVRLWRECGRVDFSRRLQATGWEPPLLRDRLDRLLSSGRLTAVGSDGQTALSHLDRLRTVPVSLPLASEEAIHRQQLFNTVIDELANPRTIDQDLNNTCGVTSAQRELCRSHPADYVGLVVGLASTAGAGRMPNGTVIKRPDDALMVGTRSQNGRAVADTRTVTERIVQTALANHVSPTTYSNRHDGNHAGLAFIAGTTAGGMAALRSATHNRPFQTLVSDSNSLGPMVNGGFGAGRSKQALFVALQQEVLAAGATNPHVPVTVNWNASGSSGLLGTDMHWIEVTKVVQGRVYFENPQGNSFDGHLVQQGLGFRDLPRDPINGRVYVEVPGSDSGPAHRVYDDGSQSVDQAWLKTSIEMVVVDPELQKP